MGKIFFYGVHISSRYFQRFIYLCAFLIGFSAAATPSSKDVSLGTYVLKHLENYFVWKPVPFFSQYSWDLSTYQWIFSWADFSIDMSPSVHLLMIFIVVAFLAFLALTLRIFSGITSLAPPRGSFSRVVESSVSFLRDQVCIANMGPEYGKKLAPIFCTLFFFILSMNLLGLIPGLDTATANVSVAAALGTISFFIAILSGIKKFGVRGFLSHLCPPGVPVFLAPFLFLIEFLGLFVRPFALMVRLFANMLAGHIVLGSLLGILVMLRFSGIPLISMVLLIYLLELCVAFIQAFIFVVLTSVFVGGIVHSSH